VQLEGPIGNGASDVDLASALSDHTVWETEEAGDLAVVLSHFNPCGYRQPVLNLLSTLDHLASLHALVYLVYLGFPGRPDPLRLSTQLRDRVRIAVCETSTVWFHKESLWNYGVRNLVPPEIDKILLLDADVHFVGDDPLGQVSERLERDPAVQPFAEVTYLDALGIATGTRASVGYAMSSGWADATEPRRYRAGLGIALRREFWTATRGLYLAPVGGGDTLLCAALTGRWRDLEQEFLAQSASSWERYRWWAQEVEAWSSGALGVVPVELVHRYHGAMQRRRYDERRTYLAGFDPRTHVETDSHGLPGWSAFARATAPDMVALVAEHFTNRREDD
jgi:hypothetical protein